MEDSILELAEELNEKVLCLTAAHHEEAWMEEKGKERSGVKNDCYFNQKV